ncbi:RDD family protein [Streptomyces sp. ODS28]|uniref:RDD family protein n=1 Tax=Streptomyces sp. ODS28 TaxID=3136688 RepID=UPI0031EB9D36
MSAPPSGFASGSPSAGYYPDPSIPGYVRYWNGSAWVPGTSRPAPQEGEPLPPPPSAAASQAATPPTPSEPAPAEETGPVFLDEDAGATAGPEPAASAWQADAARQDGFAGRSEAKVSWGQDGEPAPESAQPASGDNGTFQMRRPTRQAAQAPEHTVGLRRSEVTKSAGTAQSSATTPPAVPEQSAPAPAPQTPAPQQAPQQRSAQQPASAQQSAPAQQPAQQPVQAQQAPPQQPQQAPQHWAQQVHDLAAHSSAPASPNAPAGAPVGAPASGPAHAAASGHAVPGPAQGAPPQSAGPEQVTPWRPPADDPFLRAAQEQSRPAPLGKRFAARLIDAVLTGAVGAAVAVPFMSSAVAHVQQKIDAVELAGRTERVWLIDGTTGGYLAVVLGVLLVFGLLYEVLPTARWGRTLGKKLLGLSVLDVEGQNTPEFGAALRRWLVYGVLGLLAVGVVNVLWCLFDRPWRQCWHDKAARTFVAEGSGSSSGALRL